MIHQVAAQPFCGIEFTTPTQLCGHNLVTNLQLSNRAQYSRSTLLDKAVTRLIYVLTTTPAVAPWRSHRIPHTDTTYYVVSNLVSVDIIFYAKKSVKITCTGLNVLESVINGFMLTVLTLIKKKSTALKRLKNKFASSVWNTKAAANDESCYSKCNCSVQIKVILDELTKVSDNQLAVSNIIKNVEQENNRIKGIIANQTSLLEEVLDQPKYVSREYTSADNTSRTDLSSLKAYETTNTNVTVQKTNPEDYPTNLAVDPGHRSGPSVNNDSQQSFASVVKGTDNQPRKADKGTWQQRQGKISASNNSRPRPTVNKPTVDRRRTNFISGTLESEHSLKTTGKKTFLFVSRLSQETECDDLKSFLNDKKKADCVVEKLTPKYPDQYSSFKEELNFYVPSGYKLITSFTRSFMKHGGVSIYVATNFTFDFLCINVKELCEEQQFEAVAVAFPDLNLIVVAVYRAPNSDINIFTDKLEKCILFINKSYKYKNSKVVIAGDINIDLRNSDLKIRGFLDRLRS
ncbi:hypothetical protein J6590_049917 [Homalodisca vitripennis]|nr:hypothetical protein J6590_049917 [Homalodisca vitripennis]